MSDGALVFWCLVVPVLIGVGVWLIRIDRRSNRRANQESRRFCPWCGWSNQMSATTCIACRRLLPAPAWAAGPRAEPSPVVSPGTDGSVQDEESHIRWLLTELERDEVRAHLDAASLIGLTTLYQDRLADLRAPARPSIVRVEDEEAVDREAVSVAEAAQAFVEAAEQQPWPVPNALPHTAPVELPVVAALELDEPAPPIEKRPAQVALPPLPARPPREPFQMPQPWKEWDSAVILLYLGAFLVVAAGLVYASYSWEQIGGWQKVGLLALATIAFAGGGLVLLPFARVRPAAETFIGIGAFLVPMNALAINNMGSRDATSRSAVGEIGALLVTALYGFFAFRPGGIVYRYATVVGALTAVVLLPGAVGAALPWGAPLVALATAVVPDAPRRFGGRRRRFAAPVVHVGIVVLPVAAVAGVAARWAESVDTWWIAAATLAATSLTVARLALRREDDRLARLWTGLALSAVAIALAALDLTLSDSAVACVAVAAIWLGLGERGPALARRNVNRDLLHAEAAVLLLAAPIVTYINDSISTERPLLSSLAWVAAAVGAAAIARLRGTPSLLAPAAILATIAYVSFGDPFNTGDFIDSAALSLVLAPAPLLLAGAAVLIQRRLRDLDGIRWARPVWAVAFADAIIVTFTAYVALAAEPDTGHKLAAATVCAAFALTAAAGSSLLRLPDGLLAAAVWLEFAAATPVFALPISGERRLPVLVLVNLVLAGFAAWVRFGGEWNVVKVRRTGVGVYLVCGGVAVATMLAITAQYVVDLQRPTVATAHPDSIWWWPYLGTYALIAALGVVVCRRWQRDAVWVATGGLGASAILALRMAYGTLEFDPWRLPAIVVAIAGVAAAVAVFWRPRIDADGLLRRHLIGLVGGCLALPAGLVMAAFSLPYVVDLERPPSVTERPETIWWLHYLGTFALVAILGGVLGRRWDVRSVSVTTGGLAAFSLLGVRMAYGEADLDPWRWPPLIAAVCAVATTMAVFWRPRIPFDGELRRHLIGLVGACFALPGLAVMLVYAAPYVGDLRRSPTLTDHPAAGWWWPYLVTFALVIACSALVGRRRDVRAIWAMTTALAATTLLGLRMAYGELDVDPWRWPAIVTALGGLVAVIVVLWRPRARFDELLRDQVVGLFAGCFGLPALALMGVRTALYATEREQPFDLVDQPAASWWWPDLVVYVAVLVVGWWLGRKRDVPICATLVAAGLVLGDILGLRMLYGNLAIDGRHWWALIGVVGLAMSVAAWRAARGRANRFAAFLEWQGALAGGAIGIPAIVAMLAATVLYAFDLTEPYDLAIEPRTGWWWPFLGFFVLATAAGCYVGPRLRRLDLSLAVSTSAIAALSLVVRMAYAAAPFDRLTWLPLLTATGAATAVVGLGIRRSWSERFGRRVGMQVAVVGAVVGLAGLIGSIGVTIDYILDATRPYAAAHAEDGLWWWRFLVLHLAVAATAWTAGRRTGRAEAAPATASFAALAIWLAVRMTTTDLVIWTYVGMVVALLAGALRGADVTWRSSSFMFSLRRSLDHGGVALGVIALGANLGLSVSGEGNDAVQAIVYAVICAIVFGVSLWLSRPWLAYGATVSAVIAISFGIAALDTASSNAGYAFAALSWVLAAGSLTIPVAGRWSGQRIVWERSAFAVAALPIGLGVLPDGALDPTEPAYQRLVLAILSAAGVLAVTAIVKRSPLRGYAASVVTLCGVLMQIASAEPANVQAYTIPVSLYLLGLGWTRRREPIVYDSFVGAGAALLMFPSFAQSFGEGGYSWALICGAEGLAFVFAGLVAGRRIPVAAGVVGLTAIVLRETVDYVHSLPTWAILAVVGIVLLSIGTLWLAARDSLTRRYEEMRARWGGLT